MTGWIELISFIKGHAVRPPSTERSTQHLQLCMMMGRFEEEYMLSAYRKGEDISVVGTVSCPGALARHVVLVANARIAIVTGKSPAPEP